MHRGRVGTGEQQFNRHRAQWADSHALHDPGRGECSIHNHRAERPDRYAHRQPHPGFDQRNVDRAEWAKRYAIDDVWGREFTNNFNGSQWRRRYSERFRTGHWYCYRDYGWTAWCDRHQGAHALNEDWRQNMALPGIDSEARPAFVSRRGSVLAPLLHAP